MDEKADNLFGVSNQTDTTAAHIDVFRLITWLRIPEKLAFNRFIFDFLSADGKK